MLLLLPMGCSEEKPETPKRPEKAEKPSTPSGPAAQALPALKLEAFADLPPQEPLTVTRPRRWGHGGGWAVRYKRS
jgi:hypothetical protein